MRSIGVFGGTFDPPHLGHLIVAADVCVALELDRLLFIPAAVPPHKLAQVEATAEQRLEMVRAAVRGDARFEVDDLELRRPGPSFTVDTLHTLRTRFPESRLYFLIGADALREIHSWREPEEVARLAQLIVFARDGQQAPTMHGISAQPVPVTRVDISASEIRRRVRAGIPIRYLVPDAVREIIERENLYGTI
ncbi:MAG: nicotinate-nucleotide adenylyltransferase [Gemmatimonadetes bacterium]|nr:nicotinate-nucleotide adenylyltransferase [Gemmatimonadota bacterium]